MATSLSQGGPAAAEVPVKKVSVSTVRTDASVHLDARMHQNTVAAVPPEIPPEVFARQSAATVAAFPNNAAEAGLEGRPLRYSALTCRGLYEFQIRAPMGPGAWHSCVTVVQATLYTYRGMHTFSDGFLSIEDANQIGGFNRDCLGIDNSPAILPETFEAVANERPCLDGSWVVPAGYEMPHIVPFGAIDTFYINFGWQDQVEHLDPAITEWLIRWKMRQLGIEDKAVCTSTHEAGLRNWAVGQDASGTYGGAFQTNTTMHANGALRSVGLRPFDVMDIGYSLRVTAEQVVYMHRLTGIWLPVGTWGGAAGC